MPVSVVIGAQWGDEGKGKVVDLLAPSMDIVARYQGGANAGYTIKWGDETFVLHLIPSGIFHEGTACVIGNGVVIDPKALMDEIRQIEALGYPVAGRLKISHNAHLIMPYHKALDEAKERWRDAEAIGTTRLGEHVAVARDVLRHRLVVNYEAEADGIGADEVIAQLLDSLRTP